jgi:hypothetical protein
VVVATVFVQFVMNFCKVLMHYEHCFIVFVLFFIGVHLGLRKMYMAINQFYFWKGLYIDIAHFVRECEQCSEAAELQPVGFEQHQRLEETEDGNVSRENKNTGSGNASKVWQKVRYC